MKICSIPGCGRQLVAHTYCGAHVAKYYKYGDPLAGKTNVMTYEGCIVQGCDGEHKSKGYCGKHYQRLRKHGDALREPLDQPNGSGWTNGQGYVLHTINGEQRLKHVLIAERALGRRMPKGCEVHHVDENPSNNIPVNLVICPSGAYHKLLHARTRAYDACGNANWRRCWICKVYDDCSNLRNYGREQYHHRDCFNSRKRIAA